MVGMLHRDAYVGDEAQSKRGILTIRRPLEKGEITNWDDMEKIWHHTFYNELRIAPEEHPILLTESTLTYKDKKSREKQIQAMFETFNTPKYYVCPSPVLSLYASGRTTGIVLDSGYGLTATAPIYEGYVLPHAVNEIKIGGQQITEYLNKLLNDNGYSFNTTADKEFVRDIKEKLCFTAIDFKEEIKESQRENLITRSYELPDYNQITVNEERFKCLEVMFNPNILEMDEYKTCDGIDKMVYDSIMKCDEEIHEELFGNIILNGGNMTFKGMDDRLSKELNKLIIKQKKKKEKRMRVNVVRNMDEIKLVDGYLAESHKYIYPEIGDMIYNKFNDPSSNRSMTRNGDNYRIIRKYNAWIGGAILSSLSTFEEMWITKDLYDENGPDIVHSKCC